jgi:hypothetical protein
MWQLWMSPHFGIRRRDILKDDITIHEVIAMWDAYKETTKTA